MSIHSTKQNILQIIDGFNFRLYPTEKYFKGWCVINGIKTKTSAQRYVWQKHNGSIEKGLHVHHKDEDKSNNDIENLELLSPKEHSKKHFTEERKQKAIKVLLEKAIPKSKEWHSSEIGRKWHKEHAKKSLQCETRSGSCKHCGNGFETKSRIQIYCSYKCKVDFNNKKKKRV